MDKNEVKIEFIPQDTLNTEKWTVQWCNNEFNTLKNLHILLGYNNITVSNSSSIVGNIIYVAWVIVIFLYMIQ